MSKKWIFLGLALAIGAGGYFGYQHWLSQQNALPPSISFGNGRVEAKLVDIAPKEALRVRRVFFKEGDLVKPGDVLVEMDTATLQAQFEEARLNILATQAQEAVTRATIERNKAQVELARIDVSRAETLLQQNAGTQRDLDVRRTQLKTSQATLEEEEARLATIRQQVKVAKAQAAVIQTRIDDATLRSTVSGRVLYRLAEEGEILGAGGKAMTLVNFDDVYMEIFLPGPQAMQVRIGADARLVGDGPEGIVVPGVVTFVSPEAQFTPKQVETRSERDKLMFRVKISVPEKIIQAFIDDVKTGMRGTGYIRLDSAVPWPPALAKAIEPPAVQ